MRNCLLRERLSSGPKQPPPRQGWTWTHQQWLGQHQELYTEAIKGCERRLRRQALITACKQRAWIPVQLLTTACGGLFNAALAYPRRRSLRAKLKDRIQELDHSSELKFAQQLQERIQAMERRGLR